MKMMHSIFNWVDERYDKIAVEEARKQLVQSLSAESWFLGQSSIALGCDLNNEAHVWAVVGGFEDIRPLIEAARAHGGSRPSVSARMG
jgi:hypothetical protein